MSTIEKKRFKEILDDPVLWAKAFVKTFDPVIKKITPWVARWYQVEMLRDQSLRKVARCGRRTGKCLPGWVKVFDPMTGRRVPIEELYQNKKANILTMTENYKIEKHDTNIVLDNGIKEVFKVKLKSGREIDATGNHPLYTINGWQDIDNLEPGTKVATPRIMNHFGKKEMDKKKIKLIAYMIGDGNSTSGNLRFSNSNSSIIKEMTEAVNLLECDLKKYESSKEADYSIVKQKDLHDRTVKNGVKEFLMEVGLHDKGAYEKHVPDVIFELKEDLIKLFLSRLYGTDGWASSRTEPKNMSEIGYCSVSKQLVLDIQHLLLRFGIRSNIQNKKVKYNGSTRIAYQLLIYSKDDILKFSELIGIYSKEDALKKAVEISNLTESRDDLIPVEIMKEVEEERLRLKLKKKDLCMSKHDRLRMNYSPQRSTVYHYGKIMNNERLTSLGESDIYWDEIVSIESIGMHQTYDLTVPHTHNFIAEDIIVHNTEVMCIDSLHKTYTKPKFRVLFITPYENQVRLIFMRLRELIDMSPILKQEVVKITSNPFQIVWKNGGAIMGFTTGASSGSGGASVRGQKADMLYLDESDYMAEADFDTITTIAAERNDIGIFLSSTPTGKRGKFYQACTNKAMGYNEHHHPSTHNPNWDEKMEAEFKAQLSDQGYIHEILAEFGTQDTGVFDKDKIDQACEVEFYTYDKLTDMQKDRIEKLGIKPNIYIYENRAPVNPFRTFGVDFDKYSASSSILILDYDVIREKFKVIRRVEVPRAEYSYDKAVNTIVELNDMYNPSFIYCDRGAGEYQLERLHIIGDQRPSTGLKNKVRGWQFKNTIDIIDPITKEKNKEPMKPFMVNQLQIAFERNKMILSPFDETLHKQLIDYEVIRQGTSGPVFTNVDEHFVDALGLAYLAFVLEFSQLTDSIKKPEFTSKITHTSATIGQGRVNAELLEATQSSTSEISKVLNHDGTELRGDRQTWVKVDMGYRGGNSGSSWGSRTGGMKRSSW